MTFDEYYKEYPLALKLFSDALTVTNIDRLEYIALYFDYMVEEQLIDLKDGNERKFLENVLVKTTNELFCVLGCLKNGAFSASFHHARAVLEMFASVDHVYSKPSQKDRKLKKFSEYQDVAKYMHYVKWKGLLDRRKITDAEFQDSGCISYSMSIDLETRVPEWRKIWKLNNDKPFDIPHWHYSASIENLFQSSEETKIAWDIYEMLCHITHLSPLGSRLTDGHFLIGFPIKNGKINVEAVNRVIDASVIGAQQLMLCLNKKANVAPVKEIFTWVPDK